MNVSHTICKCSNVCSKFTSRSGDLSGIRQVSRTWHHSLVDSISDNTIQTILCCCCTVAPLVQLVYNSLCLCRKNKVHCISRFQVYHGRSSRDQCMLFHAEASDIICLPFSIPGTCMIVVGAIIPKPPPLHVRCVWASPRPDMSVRPLPWMTLTLGSIRNLSISGTSPTY